MVGGAGVDAPEQFREYLLASIFGYTPLEIDDQPAARLDWLLACHGAVEKAKADKRGSS